VENRLPGESSFLDALSFSTPSFFKESPSFPFFHQQWSYCFFLYNNLPFSWRPLSPFFSSFWTSSPLRGETAFSYVSSLMFFPSPEIHAPGCGQIFSAHRLKPCELIRPRFVAPSYFLYSFFFFFLTLKRGLLPSLYPSPFNRRSACWGNSSAC